MKGRRIIYTDAERVTVQNVRDVVGKALQTHLMVNLPDIQKLWDYYRGEQNIKDKTREIRSEINNIVCENRAYEVVEFFKGYVFGEPIQYVRRENSKSQYGDDAVAADINLLNSYMNEASKTSVDGEIAEWLYVSGSGYRLLLPNVAWDGKGGDEAPFSVYSLDPRCTFVAYSSGFSHEPIFAVTYVIREDKEMVVDVYDKDYVFHYIEGDGLPNGEPGGIDVRENVMHRIPIIEYPANRARLGVFETVLALLDAINMLQSTRMDDIEQFVNSFLAIIGGDMDEDTYQKILEYKMLCVPEGVDAKYIGKNMSETDTQTLKSDLYKAVYEICGMPNRNGGSSTSDTGTAVQLRDGWSSAESRAKSVETFFRKSEKEFLGMVLEIIRATAGTRLTVKDIETHFTRRNYENIVSKAQVLTTMLANGQIAPELAFASCGMFVDAEAAYLQSKQYVAKKERETLKREKEVASVGNQQSTGGDPVSAVPEETAEP